MRKIILLIGLACSFEFTQAQKTTTDNRFAGMDTAVARILKQFHAAGLAVAVVEKNKIIYAKGFGYRNYESKLPVTTNTLFAIGSCTKAFTASLLGILRQDGKIDFDKPVRNYLPGLKFFDDEMNNKITLRDMMCHRTGLPRHDYSWYYFTTPSRDSLIQRIQYLEPSTGYREKWQYNNFMFLVQGVTAEKITGKTWEENIREKIFQPLEMNHSVFSIDDMFKSEDAAIGYNVEKDSVISKTDYYNIDAMGPAGSINSNVNEMSNWLIAWINRGKFNGKQVIPEAYISEAMTSQMSIGAGSLPTKEHPDIFFSDYGLGWILSSYKGHYWVVHGGNIDGFSASACFFPADSIGIVTLVNQSGSLVPSAIRNQIIDRMFKLKYFDWTTELKKTEQKNRSNEAAAEKSRLSNQKSNTKPTHELSDYAGLYKNNGYGIVDVYTNHDSLFLSFGKRTMWLRHYHYDMFEPLEKNVQTGIDTSDRSIPVQFQMNLAGDIESLSFPFEPALKDPIVFSRTPRITISEKDSLQKYVGEYDLGGVAVKVFIKNGQTLFLSVPGQPEYELAQIDNDKFTIKSLTGFTIQFNRNSQNDIIELLSIQPNGTFKATRKK